MKLSSGLEQRRARVEMIPLMDVMFLLLVFFIYAMTSMVVHRGISVQLPSAVSSSVDPREPIVLTIDAQNRIVIDQQVVTAEEAIAYVMQQRAGDADAPVFVSGDHQADLGLAINLLDKLRLAGVEQVSFQTSARESQP